MITLAASSWRQTATDVVLAAAAVTALLTLWARVFSGPIGKWLDARITVATKPMQEAIAEMRTANTIQHHEVRSEIVSLRGDLTTLTDRLDGHIDAANTWRRNNQGDAK